MRSYMCIQLSSTALVSHGSANYKKWRIVPEDVVRRAGMHSYVLMVTVGGVHLPQTVAQTALHTPAIVQTGYYIV